MLQVLRAYGKVFSFINDNKIWSFYWLPIVFNLSLLVSFYFFISSNVEDIVFWLSELMFSLRPEEINQTLLLLIKGLVYTISLYYIYQPLSLIVLSPLFSLLSENVQDCINNKRTGFSLSRFWVDVKRGVKIAIRNLLIQVPILFLLFIISVFLPFLTPVTFILTFLLTSYFYGFTMLDYRNEYYRLNPKESIAFVNSNFISSITIGGVLNLILYIPVLGTVFGPAVALVAAALTVLEKDKQIEK